MVQDSEIDLPEALAEVMAAFDRYEKALITNDVKVLDDTFRVDPRTVRYGTNEILYGHDEIAAFRAARSPAGLTRTISKTVITTYGRDFAVASTLFHRATMVPSAAPTTMFDGWRVVAAHVSVIEEKDVWRPA